MAELIVIGLNHRTAPVEVREPLALTAGQVTQLLKAFHAERTLEEALLLSTCNRTELYALARPQADPLAYFLDHVGRLRGAPATADPAVFYRHRGLEAARHLMRVAASLDSQIIGEHQVLGQVKDAYRLAVEARTTGFLLNKLLHGAFRAGKRVQTETDLGRGSVGIASAAVELAGLVFSGLTDKAVLLVGAGQNAECAARALVRSGAARLIVANRTLQRARQLADALILTAPGEGAGLTAPCPNEAGEGPVTCPGLPADASNASEDLKAMSPAAPPHVVTEAVGLDEIPAVLPQVDLVLASTGAPEPVLTFDALAPVLRDRRRPLLIIDIAVPRDVDARLADLDNVYLYNIDDLNRLVERNLARRRAEVPRAEAIVDQEWHGFAAWLASLDVAPTIRLLTGHLAALQQQHLDRYGRRFCDADREQLARFTETLGSRFLARPVEFLRAVAERGTTSETLAAVDLVQRLFGLDGPAPPDSADADAPSEPPP